jgi:hypothetical protein
MLVDTFWLRREDGAPDPEPRVLALHNPEAPFTKVAAETKTEVRIPNIAALEQTLRSLGFFVRRIDHYSAYYDQGVGGRLKQPLQRVGLLAIRLENLRSPDKTWSGWMMR